MLTPENIHCLALNYHGVGDESSEAPLYFAKSRLAFCQNNAEIAYPKHTSKLWTEVELSILVGKDCSGIDQNEAEDHIEGYSISADLTCSNLYGRDHHLGFSKSRLNFCPTGLTLVSLDLMVLKSLEMTTEINGKITQKGSTAQMRYDPHKSLSYVSNIVPLSRGDLILTGTPPGHENNTLHRGDSVRHIIERVGELRYKIV